MPLPHRTPVPEGWQPKVIALDIDGTLMEWFETTGQTRDHITPAVVEAVQRAYAAGAHIVLASGRSPHGMNHVADMLGIPRGGAERLWMVCSNGAVITRYPPEEVVHEESFNARDAVYTILKHHPDAAVAIEERGIGYRLNRHFPPGELNGEMIITPLDELVRDPVSRVIIRDPQAEASDFIALGHRLGLQSISYVVGWTAWLDLTPVGISKASGLAYVMDELGLEPADILAIGDGRNDLEMFAYSGRAVAMGQALDEVKEAADDVTLSVSEDGCAVEIDRWFRS